LVRTLIIQVVFVIGAALLVAVPLTIVSVNGAASAQFTATVEPSVVITTSVAILVLGVLAALGAMRRVARIDPAAATTRLTGGGLA
jgi:ABC-type antimicrobial peptide transport system permease subunit